MTERDSSPIWRTYLKRIPGLQSLYRSLRAGWWKTKDTANDLYWRMRGALPANLTAKHRVSDVWGKDAVALDTKADWRAKGWLGIEDILWGYVFPKFDGKDWYQYLASHYCKPPRALALSLCCGSGEVERNFLRLHLCNAAEGTDISPQAIKVCRRSAESAGLLDRLTYHVSDVEHAQLDPAKYDLIIAWMAFHHLRRLDHVFREVKRALKPNGIFILNEYVGPARFQVHDQQVALVNTALLQIPEELRRLPDGRYKDSFSRPSLREIINHDPSEAIRSHRILPLLKRHLEIVECIEYGGCLLNWLMQGISQNFDPGNPEHKAVLTRLFEIEREALQNGGFTSDFAFVIARRF